MRTSGRQSQAHWKPPSKKSVWEGKGIHPEDSVSIVHRGKFSFLFTTVFFFFYQVMDALNRLFHEDYKLNFLILLFLLFSVGTLPHPLRLLKHFPYRKGKNHACGFPSDRAQDTLP